VTRDRRFLRAWLAACAAFAGASDGAPATATTGAAANSGAVDIAAGTRMSCAAQPGGAVSCWGLDLFARGDERKLGVARPFRMAGLNGVKQLVLGNGYLCGVDSNGGLRCLGAGWTDGSGAPINNFKIQLLKAIAQIAVRRGWGSDDYHACAVRRDGSVACWGSNGSGQLGAGDLAEHKDPVDVAGVAGAVEVSAGDGASCARLRDGAVLCWGRRVGLRDPQGDPLRPTKVPGLTDAVSLSSGGKLTCAARAQGSVVCWGHGGAFGVPGRVHADAPTPIPGVTGAVQVSVGPDGMACARTAAGGVVCWGSGALGDGKLSKEAAPVTVAGLTDVVQISVGGSATCARTRSSAVLCWGPNEMGDTGHPPQLQPAARPLPDRPRAARLAAGDDRTCLVGLAGEVSCRGPLSPAGEATRRLGPVAEVAAGMRHTCLRRPDGHVLCWGSNESGQLGDGTNVDRAEPAPTVPPIDDARAIATAGVKTCALRANGALACWGDADREKGPIPTGGLRDAVALAMGIDFICALRREGEVACFGGRFGKHAFGPELALARREQPPRTVAELSPARAIAAHWDQLCALRKDGVVVCTGGGRGFVGHMGERDLRLEKQRSIRTAGDGVALAVGLAHACLLRSGGSVACWGDGVLGQLGGGAAVADVAAQPVDVPGIAGAREIVAGLDHTCARLADGEVRCWGFDSDGRLTGGAASLRPGRVALP
jgi:alpha-tubulin suppressor-like RCC1 family protein